MARSYANFVTAMWRSGEWKALTVDEQHAYFLLATQPNISAVGTMPLTVQRWAGLSAEQTVDALTDTLRRLMKQNFIVIDDESQELFIRSFVRHDNGYRNKKRCGAIQSAATEIVSYHLRQALAIELSRLGLPASWAMDALSDALSPPSDTPGKHALPDEPPEPAVDNALSQVDSLSDALSDSTSLTGGDEGCGYGPYIESSTLNPQSSSLIPPPPRSPTEQLIIGLTQADDDETKLIIKTIEERHQPRNLPAYIRAMPPDDLRELLTEIRRTKPTTTRALDPPCGNCGPNRQITLTDGRAARCPQCHPLTSTTRQEAAG